MKTAVVINGVVSNVVEGAIDPSIFPDATLVDVTLLPVGPGMLYDGSVFSPKPETRAPIITIDAFSARLLLNEEVDIEVAAQDVAAGTQAARRNQARLRIFFRKITAAGRVNLNAPPVRAMVQAWESSGLIAAGRAATILDSPIQPGERPN